MKLGYFLLDYFNDPKKVFFYIKKEKYEYSFVSRPLFENKSPGSGVNVVYNLSPCQGVVFMIE